MSDAADTVRSVRPARDGPPLLNVANLLTSLRLLLVPVFAAFMIASAGTGAWWRIAACVAFLVASFTDFADGRIARRHNLVTTVGKVADPIADKALIGAALILLSALDMLGWWITVVILFREVAVTAIRFWVIRHGVIAASRGGKLKTVLQVIAIPWYIWPWPYPMALLGPWLMAAAVIVTVVTGVDYAARAAVLRRTSPRAAEKRAKRAANAAGRIPTAATADPDADVTAPPPPPPAVQPPRDPGPPTGGPPTP